MSREQQGTFGSDKREVTDNPLAPKLGMFKAPAAMTLGGISGVAGYDTSQIGDGQRVLAKVLGAAGGMLEQYQEKKKDEWELEGKLAFAQGKTEEEILSTGNKYTMAGFTTMQVRTSANEFYQNSLKAIDESDKTLDPTEYRKKLMGSFAEVSGKLGDADPFVKKLLVASSEDTMPRLVEAQTKAHNIWRENQTFESAVNMYVSEGTKTDPMNPTNEGKLPRLREIMNPEVTGLSPERHKEAITTATSRALLMGDDSMFRAIAGSDQNQPEIVTKDLPPARQVRQQALAFVAQVEGGYVSNDAGKGPTLYGINSEANPEDYAKIKATYDAGDIEAAKALAEDTYIRKYWNEINADSLSADVAIIAFDGAVNQGAGWMKTALAQAGSDPKKLLELRRQRYIEIATNQPAKAKYLDGWLGRLNKLDTNSASGAPLSQTIQGMTDEAAAIRNLGVNGFKDSEIKSIVNSYREFQTKKSQAFDKTRILTEQSLLTSAETTGNFPAALEEIAKVKEQNGYSDSWATSMATKAQSKIESGEKTRQERATRQEASNKNMLYTLSDSEAATAVKEHRDETTATVMNDPTLTPEQRVEKIRTGHGKFLVDNQQVDKTWSASIQAGLSGNILTADGKVKPEALRAYQDLQWLSENGNPGFANKFAGSAAPLVTLAERLDAGNLNSEAALAAAATQIQRDEKAGVPTAPTISTKDLNIQVAAALDKLTPGFFASLGDSNAQGYTDMQDWQIQSVKEDPTFLAMMRAEALLVMTMNPQLGKNPEAAVAQALKNLQPRIELVQGNVIVGGKNSTIRQDMGITSTATNVVGAAMDEYMKVQGGNLFGADWNTTQLFRYTKTGEYEKPIKLPFGYKLPMVSVDAIGNTIQNKVRGLPPYHASYDPATKVWTVDLYTDNNRTMLLGRPQRIAAPDVGGVYNRNVLTPDEAK